LRDDNITNLDSTRFGDVVTEREIDFPSASFQLSDDHSKTSKNSKASKMSIGSRFGKFFGRKKKHQKDELSSIDNIVEDNPDLSDRYNAEPDFWDDASLESPQSQSNKTKKKPKS